MPIFASPRLLPLGDGALTLQFGDEIGAESSALVLGFTRALEQAVQRQELPGVAEWVPAFASVTVIFDDVFDPARAAERDAALLALARAVQPQRASGRRWRLPACFDADLAPDLESLAAACGLTPEGIVERVTGTALRVYMLGFLPGFPFMGDLPAECAQPRRTSPRAVVPERSIATAGRLCGAYPWASPGGWHLIGRTPVRLFDAQAAEPALLRPGDWLHWAAVGRAEYDALERRAAAGALSRDELLDGEAA